MSWPPELTDLKVDIDVAVADERDDAQLQQVLDAAIVYVETVHDGVYRFDGDELSDLPDVPGDIWLGTIRLAGRWHTRRRSPDALVTLAELGASRVPSFDSDIERLLRIGRFGIPGIA